MAEHVVGTFETHVVVAVVPLNDRSTAVDTTVPAVLSIPNVHDRIRVLDYTIDVCVRSVRHADFIAQIIRVC